MKKTVRFFCVFLAAVFLFAMTAPIAAAEPTAREVQIIFTHDLHDHFLPTTLWDGTDHKEMGGYARLKTAMDSYQSKYPNVLKLDAGDFSMGTIFQTIYGTDAPGLRMLGQLGFDVTTTGNHEYDFRGAGLANMLKAAKASGDPLPQMVLSNYSLPADQNSQLSGVLTQVKDAFADYGVKDYTVLEKNGVKIGIFGLMGLDAEECAPMSDAVFTDPVENAKRVVKILEEKEKADLIVCLSHSGTSDDPAKSEDEILAKEVPGIDLIVSGHTHTRLSQPKIVGSTVIASSGENGEYLGTLRLQQSGGKWTLQEYALVPIDSSLAPNPAISSVISGYRDTVQSKYLEGFGLRFDEVLTSSSFDFLPASNIGKEYKEEGLANLITDAYQYAVWQAEGSREPVIGLVASGTIRGSFVQGDVTAADAFTACSLGVGPDGVSGYPLIAVYLTGKELKTACEVDASIAPIMSSAQLYMSGIRYTFNPSRMIFNKVTGATLEDGSPIEDGKLYRVVCSLYCAQMLHLVGEKSFGLLSIVPKDKNGNPVSDFESQILHTKLGGKTAELKEWYALAEYLRSFGKDGVPQKYAGALGRKVIDSDASIGAVVRDPNWVSLTAAGVVLLIAFLLVFAVCRIATHKKRKAKKAARAAARYKL